jgi:hypothetical protein
MAPPLAAHRPQCKPGKGTHLLLVRSHPRGSTGRIAPTGARTQPLIQRGGLLRMATDSGTSQRNSLAPCQTSHPKQVNWKRVLQLERVHEKQIQRGGNT